MNYSKQTQSNPISKAAVLIKYVQRFVDIRITAG